MFEQHTGASNFEALTVGNYTNGWFYEWLRIRMIFVSIANKSRYNRLWLAAILVAEIGDIATEAAPQQVLPRWSLYSLVRTSFRAIPLWVTYTHKLTPIAHRGQVVRDHRFPFCKVQTHFFCLVHIYQSFHALFACTLDAIFLEYMALVYYTGGY